MSYVWDRSPIMSNEELEELMNRPPDRSISAVEYREFNFAFAVSTIFACIFGVVVWVSLAWAGVWLCVNGSTALNHVIDELLK